jgi:hypothetical protein
LKDKDQKISFEDEISEDEQAEQATPQQELCAMPTDPSDHEFVERLDRSIELEHFPWAESKHKMNSMPVEASEHVAVTQIKEKDQKISFEYEISEDEQAEQATPQQELRAMPTDPSDHEFVERSERSIELEHFPQAESKHKMNSMPVEASEHVAVTQIEEKQVQQAEVNQELDLIPMSSRDHTDEELEGERTAQAGLEQECDSVPIDPGEHGCLTSYARTDDEQTEVKQKVTSVTADVLHYAADTFNVNTNTWKGKMLRSQERFVYFPRLGHSGCYFYYYCVNFKTDCEILYRRY